MTIDLLFFHLFYYNDWYFNEITVNDKNKFNFFFTFIHTQKHTQTHDNLHPPTHFLYFTVLIFYYYSFYSKYYTNTQYPTTMISMHSYVLQIFYSFYLQFSNLPSK